MKPIKEDYLFKTIIMKKEEMMDASAFLGVKILTPLEENEVLGGLGFLEDVEGHHEEHHASHHVG